MNHRRSGLWKNHVGRVRSRTPEVDTVPGDLPRRGRATPGGYGMFIGPGPPQQSSRLMTVTTCCASYPYCTIKALAKPS